MLVSSTTSLHCPSQDPLLLYKIKSSFLAVCLFINLTINAQTNIPEGTKGVQDSTNIDLQEMLKNPYNELVSEMGPLPENFSIDYFINIFSTEIRKRDGEISPEMKEIIIALADLYNTVATTGKDLRVPRSLPVLSNHLDIIKAYQKLFEYTKRKYRRFQD